MWFLEIAGCFVEEVSHNVPHTQQATPSVNSKNKAMFAVGDTTGALHILQVDRPTHSLTH